MSSKVSDIDSDVAAIHGDAETVSMGTQPQIGKQVAIARQRAHNLPALDIVEINVASKRGQEIRGRVWTPTTRRLFAVMLILTNQNRFHFESM